MKKRFNHTKRPKEEMMLQEEWENYDEGGEEEEVYAESEEGEYYAEEEEEVYAESEEGEYYAEEEEEVYAESEEGEYYAEEEEEVYAESEEGEYYAEEEEEVCAESEEGEYYAEEEEEACAEPEEGGYYGEEVEAYTEAEAGEYFAEEEEACNENGEYYDGGEEASYTEEAGYYAEAGALYAGDGEAYVGDGEIIYEDDDIYNVDLGEEQGHTGREYGKKPQSALLRKLISMSVMDRVIAGTGILVLLLALVTGGVWLRYKIVQSQVSGFVSVGSQLEDIELIGGDGLLAVADAQIARLEAANLVLQPEETDPPEEDEENPDYTENEYSRQITVEMEMTSIQKDLKIKFTNKKTGKLVANVPFSVNITDPDGKTSIWSDDDMDGIIYKKDIAPGTYKVAMEELSDAKYAGYAISTKSRSVEVKKDIAYEKVDVSNEVKKETEVDASKEDTAKNETVVESALQDTVAWVESTTVGTSYIEVAKSEIVNPLDNLKVAGILNKSFQRMTLTSNMVTVTAAPGTEIRTGGTAQLTAAQPVITGDAGEKVTITELTNVNWTSLSPDVATVDNSGLVTGVAAGEAVIQYSATAKVTVQPADPSVSGGDAGSTATGNTTAATNSEISVSGQITIRVGEASGGTLTADRNSLGIVVRGTDIVQVTARDFAEGKKLLYKAVSDRETVATATVDAAGKVTITGVAAGTANITVTANYETGGTAETEAKTVITVTVGANKALELDSTATLAYVGNPLVLNATIKGVSSNTPGLTVESSDATVVKATVGTLTADNTVIKAPITLEPLKEGSAILTVKCMENGEEVTATCAVTVKRNPKEDKQTALQDKAGNALYVVENGEYRAAAYADYFTYDKFYRKGDVKYTGWQTIGGNVYYFTADNKAVTGEQVIQGAKYTFASDGTLVVGNGTTGIDVSKWNGTIDWNAVKNSGISYVIIRCGYRGSSKGALIEDSKFQANIKGATAAGLKVGVYFFTQAVDEREAVEEASMVLGLIKNYKISYPVFLDVESSGGRGDSISREMRTAVCKAFCETIQQGGYTAGIYANKNWLETKIDAGALNAYKIWLAQYAEKPTYTGRYDMWQYRSTGRVSGISGDVDMNQSYLGY